jgi:hypothetical protein
VTDRTVQHGSLAKQTTAVPQYGGFSGVPWAFAAVVYAGYRALDYIA